MARIHHRNGGISRKDFSCDIHSLTRVEFASYDRLEFHIDRVDSYVSPAIAGVGIVLGVAFNSPHIASKPKIIHEWTISTY